MQVNILEAKTELSKLIRLVETGKEESVIIARYGKPVVNRIKRYVEWIAPVAVYPGEDEMAAMALNANMILNNEIEIQEYV